MAGTPDDGSTRSVFRLLCDEYTLFLRRTGSSKSFADRLVEKYLGEGERDRDGRIRYKILEIHALPGGLTPSPYDGDFWHSYPERNIRCEISSWDSSAHWTGPASAVWREFDGRETADYKIIGIKLNHDIVLEFLDSAGLHERTQSDKPSQKSSAAPTKAPAQIKAKTKAKSKAKTKAKRGAERKYSYKAIQDLAREKLAAGAYEHRSWFYESVRQAGKDHRPRVTVPKSDRTLGRIIDDLFDKAEKCAENYAERKSPILSPDSH